jgi:iron(III) transport system substrate-binding protein
MWTSFGAARLQPVFAEFTKTKGIEIDFVSDEPDILLGRLLRGGPSAAADVLLLPSSARLDRAAVAGLLHAVDVPALADAVPGLYRDPAGHWFGIASYARAIATANERVKPGEITQYADLAKPEWHGRLCLPPLDRPSNQLLFAAELLHGGRDAAQSWMKALADSAVTLQPDGSSKLDGDDDALVGAIAEGKCDAAIVGSRTLARLADRTDEPGSKALGAVRVVWPDAGFGVSVDIVGVAEVQGSAHAEAVETLFAFLASDGAQRALAQALWAYPIKGGVPLSNPVTRWGPFHADQTPLSDILPLIGDAGALAEQAGWK